MEKNLTFMYTLSIMQTLMSLSMAPQDSVLLLPFDALAIELKKQNNSSSSGWEQNYDIPSL
jgi:hypothetical protein